MIHPCDIQPDICDNISAFCCHEPNNAHTFFLVFVRFRLSFDLPIFVSLSLWWWMHGTTSINFFWPERIDVKWKIKSSSTFFGCYSFSFHLFFKLVLFVWVVHLFLFAPYYEAVRWMFNKSGNELSFNSSRFTRPNKMKRAEKNSTKTTTAPPLAATFFQPHLIVRG